MSSPPSPLLSVDLAELAEQASREAGGVTPALLGDYLAVVAGAAANGRRLTRSELDRYRGHGERAAEDGISLRLVVDLYLSATWRLWRHLPAVTAAVRDLPRMHAVGESVLRAADDAVAAVTEGYQLARRQVIGREVAERREFVDDLLSGRADVAGLVDRAEQYGLNLTGAHTVSLVLSETTFTDEDPLVAAVERMVGTQLTGVDRSGLLVASKEGLLVCVVAADRAGHTAIEQVTEPLVRLLRSDRMLHGQRWQMGVGRPYPGPTGVLRSYDEARDALDIAARLDLTEPVVHARDLLVYQVLSRDGAALVDLVRAVLEPLTTAQGGAEPLLHTLATYFATGAVATEAARRLHLSVRAVIYRLERIHALTGHDPRHPAHQFTLHAAVLGAQLLDWPTTPLPESS